MLLSIFTLALAPTAPAWQGQSDAALGAEPGEAHFNYTYGELDLAFVDPDYSGSDTELGIQAVGSYRAWRDLFVRVSYLDSGGDADLSLLKVGAGWAVPLQPKLDAYGLFSIGQVDVGSADDTGWALEGGVRYMANEQIELNALLEIIDFEDTEVGLGAGGRYYFNPQLSAGANFETISDFANIFTFGVRYQF
jgi:opacity protein-like surface antigen